MVIKFSNTAPRQLQDRNGKLGKECGRVMWSLDLCNLLLLSYCHFEKVA